MNSQRIRALAVVHARAWSTGGHALAGGVAQAVYALALAGLVADGLPAPALFLFAGSIAWGLMTAALAGDVGYSLRYDLGRDWAEALPATGFERRAGRVLALLGWIAFQTLTTMGPAALLVGGLSPLGRLGFLGLALLSNATFVALTLALQAVLLRRLPSLWIAMQTALTAGLLAGAVLFLPQTAQLAGVQGFEDLAASPLMLWPVTWFAASLSHGAPLWMPLLNVGVACGAIGLWLAAPQGVPSSARTGGLLDRILAPLASTARRTWVAPSERASFDLVLWALPAEREVALRALPLLGVPLAFLWFGDTAGVGANAAVQREGLLALILFTPAVYLPVLMAYVTASASSRARWLLDLAPLTPEAIHGGAFKAVVLRYILPLYALLVPLAWSQAGGSFVLHIAPLALAVTVFACRGLYGSSVSDWPLSRPPGDVEAPMQLGGHLLGLGVGLAVAAVVVVTRVSIGGALAIAAGLVAFEVLNEVRRRRTLVSS